MAQLDIIERINELEREIALLPPGSIAVKKVKSKDYYYHRITQNQKRTETYVDFDQVEELRAQIEKKKGIRNRTEKTQETRPLI